MMGLFYFVVFLCGLGFVNPKPDLTRPEKELGIRIIITQPIYHRYIGDVTMYNVSFQHVIGKSIRNLESILTKLEEKFPSDLGAELVGLLEGEITTRLEEVLNYFHPTSQIQTSRRKRALRDILRRHRTRKTQDQILSEASIIIDSYNNVSDSQVHQTPHSEQTMGDDGAQRTRFGGSLSSIYHTLPIPSSISKANATIIDWGKNDEDLKARMDTIERKTRKVESQLLSNDSGIFMIIKEIIKIYMKTFRIIQLIQSFMSNLGQYPLSQHHLEVFSIECSPVALLEGIQCDDNLTCTVMIRCLPQVSYNNKPCFKANIISLPLYYPDYDIHLVFSHTTQEAALCFEENDVSIPYVFDNSAVSFQPFIVGSLRTPTQHDKVRCVDFIIQAKDLPETCTFLPFSANTDLVSISNILVIRSEQSASCCGHTTNQASLEYFQFNIDNDHLNCDCSGHMIPTIDVLQTSFARPQYIADNPARSMLISTDVPNSYSLIYIWTSCFVTCILTSCIIGIINKYRIKVLVNIEIKKRLTNLYHM